ncbi:SDR family NAD(P)-dependent oxidoreductase [Chloroflexota bacterium]
MKLKDKVAIITGAGRGIGKAIALAFAREGADVVAVARTLHEIERTATEVRALRRIALSKKVNVSNWENVIGMVNSVINEVGKIDILVNNAGVQGSIGPLVHNDITQWINTIHTNLIGTFLCTRAVLPLMVKQKRGKIINLSGGGATTPLPYFSAYAASKAAVVRLTETVAEEVKEFNIQINAIAPGAVNTHMLEEILAAGDLAGQRALTEARRRRETGGVAPDRAAALAVFLASDESNGLSGRLISAVWDDWQNIDRERTGGIMSQELYTLRRIDGILFSPKDKR